MNKENEGTKRQEVKLQYGAGSEIRQGETSDEIIINGNSLRDKINFKGKVKDNILVRESLAALYEVVSGDFSYKPKDRSAYLAYQTMKKKNASASAWEARQAYFDWLERNDPDAWLILDPVVSVFPDQITFEVFSKDEGAYAMASINWDAFELEKKPECGTTNIDFSKEFAVEIEKMRSYRETVFEISTDSVSVKNDQSKAVEKKISLPTSWLRGLMQVQSAALLAKSSFKMMPMDFYNILRHLRLNKDQKKGGRALRIELVPGETPRLVLEPWNLVIETSGEKFKGQRPEIIRLWGRRRLKVLARLLPMAESIDVFVMGSGMPSYFIVKAGAVTFTLAITGFSSSNWSQSLAFDLLLPRNESENGNLQAVLKLLNKERTMEFKALAEKLKLSEKDLLPAIQKGCQQGLLIYDLHSCRLRPLLDKPIPEDELKFRNQRERHAYDLLAAKNAVKLENENYIHDVGVEIIGKIRDDKKDFRPLLRLSNESRVLKAECTCPHFRKHQLKEGPCEHLIALRLRFGEIEIDRRLNPDRETVIQETRSYAKRNEAGSETIYQLTLNDKRLTKRWGPQGANLKKHAMVYNCVKDARKAYFEQIDTLEAKGFVDARS